MEIIRFMIVGWTLLITEVMVITNSEIWPLERPDGMPTIQSLEVMCGKDHMDVHLQFSQPFEGIVSSKGQYGDPRCVYVPPSTGKTYFTFRIAYARCGTKPDLNGQFYENTVVVQYDKDLLEVWDEAKRLRCEWYNDYEKTASKPPMVIADLDVVQLDFRGDNVDCWMEIQHGKGPWAPPVSGIVPLGSTLTLVVAINDYRGEFDMRVKSCAASDGGHHIIQLSDEHGCVLRPKMISRFLKARITDERASVITYAFFHAFKFPDAISVHIKCKVEICRHGCLDHCQLASTDSIIHSSSSSSAIPTASFEDYNTLERKDTHGPSASQPSSDRQQDRKVALRKDTAVEHAQKLENNNNNPPEKISDDDDDRFDDLIYDDGISIDENDHNGEREIMSTDEASYPAVQQQNNPQMLTRDKPDSQILAQQQQTQLPIAGVSVQQVIPPSPSTQTHRADGHHERFPHGPRKLKEDVQTPSNTNTDHTIVSSIGHDRKKLNSSGIGIGVQKRRRRSFVVSDNKASNANVGVSGLYEVVSEADLAFTPDNKDEAVAVFQGKISQEVVYGVCLPVPGFSAVFILMTSSVVASALIAGFLMYRYQVQKETHKLMMERQRRQQQQSHRSHSHHHYQRPVLEGLTVNSLANWMAFGFIKTRTPATVTATTTTNSNNNNNNNHNHHSQRGNSSGNHKS